MTSSQVTVNTCGPFRSLLAAGVVVAASTDAPFGSPDPWAAIAAATTRTAPSGRLVGADRGVPAAQALELFLGEPDDLATTRRVDVGERAGLCLLDRPLADALEAPSCGFVRMTWVAGRP
jgi:predicted amidohydrolase YtcJ